MHDHSNSAHSYVKGTLSRALDESEAPQVSKDNGNDDAIKESTVDEYENDAFEENGEDSMDMTPPQHHSKVDADDKYRRSPLSCGRTQEENSDTDHCNHTSTIGEGSHVVNSIMRSTPVLTSVCHGGTYMIRKNTCSMSISAYVYM
jgi:hypothetical protein